MNQSEFYEELTKFKGGVVEPLHETCAVLSYEVGRMLEQSMYLYWLGKKSITSDNLKEHNIRVGFFKSELMDAIAQILLICGFLGVDMDYLKELGIEKALERFLGKEKK